MGFAKRWGIYEDYVRLNEAANAVFFDGRFHARPVYIDLDDREAAEIADRLDLKLGDLERFLGLAISETLQGGGLDPYDWHLKQARAWISSGRVGPPPFTGLLAGLSLAADKMREDEQFSVICPLLSGPKSLLFWITKEFGNGQEAQAGRDYRQAARG